MSTRSDLVASWLDLRAEEMVDFLARLVAEPTENPPGRGLGRCAQLLQEEMRRLGLEPELIEIPAPHTLEDPFIVRGSAGQGGKLLYFHGHYDVVPAQYQGQFALRRENGKLYGRGTADMKGGIVSMVYGAAAAKELGLIRDGRIVIHLVPDEETGSVVGAGHLREHNLIDPSAVAMVTAEPSGTGIWNAARGAISLTISFEGREAHVGQAAFGINTFAHMVHVGRPLLAYAEEMAARHTGYPMAPDDPTGSMVVVGGLSGGGSNFNVVPADAWFTVDSRFNPEEDLSAELERMQTLIRDAAAEVDAKVNVEVIQFQPAAGTPVEHPAGAALARCVEEVRGEPAKLEMCGGILENRWYGQLAIPAFGYGAGRLDVSHGPHEHVDEEELFRTAAVYALYAADALA
ncbi:succinyl-diaminopimelate desuccinylase [Streptomyces sp. DI166]|uniref:M20/M25/M40 family metallo-hydrolase n=1 Tax=Streptomyces sp. DI166 TaxID=1839783 RepID=UPI0007F32D2A|nr:M20/M25/M40 family metallo-hydrolase [Streptomyces sp. DI166]SBT89049.1 succinyl-diaminopimelate desuccinylase [Streptomyces sp. DI166]